MLLCSEANWNEMASVHLHKFAFPPNGVAAFKMPTGMSPWLVRGAIALLGEHWWV